MKLGRSFRLFLATLGVMAARPACAQEINYGALSDMFGEPVTTSATGSPQTASQAPANMQIISADEIRRSGATNIPEILGTLAGIDVRNYGALQNEVAIRGYSGVFNPRLLVLINGRQVYDDDFGYTVWQALPVQLADIRQIEVVRGPASALFGFNAASGVVNIITYDPLFDATNVVEVGLGTEGTYEGSLVSTLQSPGKAGVTLSLGGLQTQDYSSRADGPYDTLDKRPELGNLTLDGRYKPASNIEVTLEVTQARASSSVIIPATYYAASDYRTNSYKAGVLADTRLGVLSLLAYMNQSKAGFVLFTGGSTDMWNQVSVVQANDLFKIADIHSIRIGLEYRDNRMDSPFSQGSVGYQNYAASLMWNWQINPTLSFTAAGRVDHLVLARQDPLSAGDPYTLADYNHATVTQPSYNLGIVEQPDAADTFRLLAGRAVQSPSLLDFAVHLAVPISPELTENEDGSPDLKASVTSNYELDYDRTVDALESTVHSAIFYNVTQDLLLEAINSVPSFTPDGLLALSTNNGHGEAFGGELGLQGASPNGLHWNADYSLVGVRTHLNQQAPEAGVEFDDGTPASIIDFGVGYAWHKLEADVSGRWQSRYQDLRLTATSQGVIYRLVSIANYVTVSGRIGYQLTPKLTLAVSGQELTSAQQVETAGLEAQRRVLFSATYTF